MTVYLIESTIVSLDAHGGGGGHQNELGASTFQTVVAPLATRFESLNSPLVPLSVPLFVPLLVQLSVSLTVSRSVSLSLYQFPLSQNYIL